ncbi:hypothetical protein KUF71_013222 [Frankliniella fusca]|uniref:Uncharacterized protein n=1 Tax=Frankliniella fusca TaxID=407009 RepID=A0AAE1LNC5_9NEOP|nr:hypothetical protein KUF71_013222 [Frankliniella fusca]
MSYRGSTSSLSALPLSSAAALAKAPTALEQLLEEINFQRTKEMRQMLKDDTGFVMVHGTTYWTDLFVRHFLFQTDRNIDCDDLLFFVRKKHIKSSSRILPKFETEVDVFRKASRKLPIGDPDMDWEETVYLNLIIHQFDYTLTLAICTRTSPKELQVLRRHSQVKKLVQFQFSGRVLNKVYASPSRRRMDTKAEVEEMTYPNVCFMVDNFNEVFSDIMVRDGEMVCVELVASDRDGAIQGVIFLGSIRYDALKRVYDARSSLSSKMAQRMTFGLFSNSSSQRVEFVRMKGPQGKGHAEMAVTKPKGYSGAETPTSEPGYCATDMWDSDWDSDPEEFFVYRHQRRLSDPSANINNFVRGGWKTKPSETAGSKARSENEGLDSLANGLNEIEAGDLRDDCEFCVHSASISTSDASIPSGTGITVAMATSSSASTSTTSMLKRLPPASSIISSFFPNCKLKRPGRAVSCVSQVDTTVSEVTEENVLNVVEIRSACDSASVTNECSDVEDLKLSKAINFDESLKSLPLLDEPETEGSFQTVSAVDSLPSSHENKRNQIKSSKELNIDTQECIKSVVLEALTDHSDDDFEDCNSFVSDTSVVHLSNSAHKSCSENEELDSGSLDIWSDAEEDESMWDSIFNEHQEDKNEESNLDLRKESPIEQVSKDPVLPSSFENLKTRPDQIEEEQLGEENADCIESSSLFTRNHLDSKGAESEDESIEIFKNEERETVIKTCENEVGIVTPSEVCAHGVEMKSLCLLCLGYSMQNTDCLLRLKPRLNDNIKTTEENTRKTGEMFESIHTCKEEKNVTEDCQDNFSRLSFVVEKSQPIPKFSQTLPHRKKSESRQKKEIPPQRVLPDGTVVYYWCDVPGGYIGKSQNVLVSIYVGIETALSYYEIRKDPLTNPTNQINCV